MWECEWWGLYRTTNTVKQHIWGHFHYRRSPAAEQLLEEIKRWKLFGYLQCDFEGPENLGSNFANFLSILKNNLVGKIINKYLMKNYSEEERLLSQPQKKLISSFTLHNGTLFTHLVLFYLQLGLVCIKVHCFVEYAPKKSFNSFVQSAVDAGRQGNQNPNQIVVSEQNNVLASSSYGYQIMDRSLHSEKTYLNDKKTHSAVNSKHFEKLYHSNKALYATELAIV